MGRHATVQFRLPDEDSWEEIRDCGLSEAQLAALRSTLDEVASRCKDIGSGPTDKAIKVALGKLDRTFDRLQRYLDSSDVVDALGVIETYGAMGRLISSTAATDLAGEVEPDVPTAGIERLIAHKRFRNEQIRPSDLDGLCLQERQRRLNHATVASLQLAVSHLRQPISSWLHAAVQDKGGNRPKSDRELLIFLLARDAQKIVGEEPSSLPGSAFFELCTSVLGACNFDDSGYEEAVERCLKKYNAWLVWYKLPTLQNQSAV